MIDRSKSPHTQFPEQSRLPQVHETEVGKARLHLLGGAEEPACRLTLLFDGSYPELGNSAELGLLATQWPDATLNTDAATLARKLDNMGARVSMSVRPHMLGMDVAMLRRKSKDILSLVGEILSSPRFDERALEVSKVRAKTSLEISRRQMANVAMLNLGPLLFCKGHPLARQNEAADFDGVTVEKLVAMHRSIYTQSGCHSYLCGQLDEATVEATEALLKAIPDTAPAISPDIRPMRPKEPQTIISRHCEAVQSAIASGIPTISRQHPDYHALRLAVMALGGYFGSRLMSNIREKKGLTYGISALLLGDREGSYATITAQCDNGYAGRVVEEIRNEIKALADNPPSGDELERMRLHAVSDSLEALDTPFSIMKVIVSQYAVGMPDNYFQRQQEVIASIDSDTIGEMARRYLSADSLRISIAGNPG